MALKKRDTQTKVKHIILSRYLNTWAGIILNGKADTARSQALKGRPFHARLAYVDGFSSTGRYEGDTTDIMLDRIPPLPTWGSPILGIQGLDKAQRHARQQHRFHIDTGMILIEDDDDDFDELRESLRLADMEARVTINPSTIAPRDGIISVTQGNFLDYVDPIMRFLDQPYTNALVLLDPYGPKGIPYAAVRRIVAQQDTDVIINLPYQDLHKKLGYLPKEGLKARDAILANYDALFGTNEWRIRADRIMAEVPTDERTKQLEIELSDFYLERLRATDPTLVVKSIRLQFPDKNRTMFYLYLTTHDPHGALALNKILHEAKLSEYVLKWDRRQATWVHKSYQEGQPPLFDMSTLEVVPPPIQNEHSVDTAELAADIRHLFANHQPQPKLRDVYAALANSDVFIDEINRALRQLRKKGFADFDDLRAGSLIRFRA